MSDETMAAEGFQSWKCHGCGAGGAGDGREELRAHGLGLCCQPPVPFAEHQRLQAEAAAKDAACAEMRNLLQEIHDAFAATYPGHLDHPTQERIRTALSSDAGKGWVSPEEHEKTEAACARYRALLERMVREELQAHQNGDTDHVNEALVEDAATALSSSDAGAALLEELAGLRAKAETERLRVDSLLREANEARAESADLRARLERAELESESRLADLINFGQRKASEVRRAVEEEREAIAKEHEQRAEAIEANARDPKRPNVGCTVEECLEAARDERRHAAAIRARSRGGAKPKPTEASDDGKCLFILPNGRCAGCRNCN